MLFIFPEDMPSYKYRLWSWCNKAHGHLWKDVILTLPVGQVWPENTGVPGRYFVSCLWNQALHGTEQKCHPSMKNLGISYAYYPLNSLHHWKYWYISIIAYIFTVYLSNWMYLLYQVRMQQLRWMIIPDIIFQYQILNKVSNAYLLCMSQEITEALSSNNCCFMCSKECSFHCYISNFWHFICSL